MINVENKEKQSERRTLSNNSRRHTPSPTVCGHANMRPKMFMEY